MKHDDISDALNNLADDLIEETNEVRQHPKGYTPFFQKYRAFAACIAVLLIFGTLLQVLPLLTPDRSEGASEGASPSPEAIDEGDLSLNFGINSTESFGENASAGGSFNNRFKDNDFALELFQIAAVESQYENVLVSPLSMMQALTMTANGADGATLAEMTEVLSDAHSLEELNQELLAYTNALPSAEDYQLQLANSIWIRDDEGFSVYDTFLNTNQTYFDAEIFTENFDLATVNKINGWVKENTNNLIPSIIEKIDQDTMMYLINALAFDAEWEEIYTESDIFTDLFTSLDGTMKNTEMMRSTEHFYISDENSTGFIKNYKDGAYRFVALLPNENIDFKDYVNSLTSDGVTQMIQNAENTRVVTVMPKFSYEYELTMNDVLKKMGMVSAFNTSEADLSKLGCYDSGNLYVGKVLHKTFISVDERGTKAGTVTSVEVNAESSYEEIKTVNLNRPFVYMIIDGNENLPVFIGTVTHISE